MTMFYEKKSKNKTKQNDKKKKHFPQQKSNPRPPAVKGYALSIAPRYN